MHHLKSLALTLASVAIGTLAVAQGQDRPDLQLKTAIYKETVEGDLQGAIALYKQIVSNDAAARPIAAAALLGLGGCYEKLGAEQARGAYERLIADYPEQAREVTEARARLAALTKGSQPGSSAPKFRRVQTNKLGVPTWPQLSPDGQRLAFCSEGAIWVVPLAGTVSPDIPGVPVSLPGVERAQGPLAWSRDGRWIAYNRGEPGRTLPSEMCVVSASGGPPRVVPFQPIRAGSTSFNISLSPDGSSLAFVHQASVLPPQGGIHVVPVQGGTPRSLTAAGVPSSSPAFSPDGKRIAFVRDDNNVWVTDADGSTSPIQASNVGTAQYPVWSPDGRMIAFVRWFGTGRTTQMCIIRVPEAAGPVSRPTIIDLPLRAMALAGWTADNRIGIVMRPEEQVALYTVPASGGMSAQITDGGRPMSPNWSPDSSRVLFLSARRGDPASEFGYVASVPSQGGQESRVPIAMTKEFYAAWQMSLSRDGRELAFSGSKLVGKEGSYGGYRLDVYAVPVGGGEPKQLTVGGVDRNPSWSPDGRSVAFIRQVREESRSDLAFRASLWTVRVDGGDPTQLTSSSLDSRPRWSPDGTLIAYMSERRTVNVIPATGGEPRVVASVDGDSDVSWSPDGSEIAYVSGGQIWAVLLLGGKARVVPTGLDAVPHDLAWSPDGGRIAFTATKGWNPELWFMEDFLQFVKATR